MISQDMGKLVSKAEDTPLRMAVPRWSAGRLG